MNTDGEGSSRKGNGRVQRGRLAALVAAVIGLTVSCSASTNETTTTTAPPATTSTSEATTTTTTQPDSTSTTTTTLPPDSSDDPTHRVVNVAADDTLNVRRAPGAGEQLYARLAPTYSGVRFTGTAQTVADGGEWWEVKLLDPVRLYDLGEPLHGAPIVGWVNSAYLAPYDPAFSSVPACQGAATAALTQPVNEEAPDHIFQIREYELDDSCLRVVITLGTDFDDSGVAPRYDMIGTDMRPVGSDPSCDVTRLQGTTVISVDGIEHAWATSSVNVASEVLNDELVDAFSVRSTDRSIDVHIPVVGWVQGVTLNPETGQMIIDVLKTGPESRLRTANGIHVVGDPVFTAGGVVEFIGLARPFEATVGVEIRQVGEVAVEDFTMTTDYIDAWGLFRYRAVGLKPEKPATVSLSQDAEDGTIGVTFEVESDLDTSRPTAEQLTDTSDLELTDTLIGFAQGEVPFGDLPLTSQVTLGLNTVSSVTVERSALANVDGWTVGPEDFDGLVGPFNALDVLSEDRGIKQVNVGPRTHCAGPPLDFGPEWSNGRHLVIEPSGIDSCLQWYAVHLLREDGRITAVILDLWGP